jgi:hypothetical protein
MLALCGFVLMVLLMLPHLNPPATARDGTPPPGNVMVEIRWPDASDADIDLWVQAPGDVPVGYSNKGGEVFNLLRDDLGHQADATGLNYEVSYSRGTPAGEYTVNVHRYRSSVPEPIPVTVAISVADRARHVTRQILATEVRLTQVGEEVTALRFELDEGGALVADSVHDLPRPLRSGAR